VVVTAILAVVDVAAGLGLVVVVVTTITVVVVSTALEVVLEDGNPADAVSELFEHAPNTMTAITPTPSARRRGTAVVDAN
jgi:Na+-transporting NADH:ubiquinone oxidoreductase subunit NqrE